jgi:hypothetical protein
VAATVTYGQLLGGKLFNVSMPSTWDMNPTARKAGDTEGTNQDTGGHLARAAPAKPVSQYTLVGTIRPYRHPGDRYRGDHLHPQRPDTWNAARACGSSGARWHMVSARRRFDDELNQAHPNVQIVRKNDFRAWLLRRSTTPSRRRRSQGQ